MNPTNTSMIFSEIKYLYLNIIHILCIAISANAIKMKPKCGAEDPLAVTPDICIYYRLIASRSVL